MITVALLGSPIISQYFIGWRRLVLATLSLGCRTTYNLICNCKERAITGGSRVFVTGNARARARIARPMTS
jgi:hypothetical protein